MEYGRCEIIAVISSMWSCQLRSCEIVTHSRRVQFICLICLSFSVIGGMSGGFYFLKHMSISFVLT